MKNLSKAILLCGLPFLFSCSVLKKSKESHASSTDELLQGSKSSTLNVDTSKKVTTEHWKITLPGSFTPKANLPKFEPLPITVLSGASKEQASAYSNLQGKYNTLVGAYNDRGKAIDQNEAFGQGLLLEMDRKITESAGKIATSNQQDSLKTKSATQLDTEATSKKTRENWIALLIIIAIVAVILIVARFLTKGHNARDIL